MKERVEALVRQFRDARKHRLRFEAAVTALSVLVTGNVFWQLRRVGTALSEEVSPRGAPIVETDADPPDLTADAVETAEDSADWEASLPEFTDETPQQRIAAVAASQIGYTEGTGEVLLSDAGLSRSGYTRYGAWYGNPYGEWNTMFTYFCMYYAGIRKADIPYGSGCWAWYETLAENGMLTPCGREQTGDIIFFDTDADGEPDRTGIVSGIEQRDDGMYLRMIEGNCDGAVAEKSYLRGGSDMIGVLSADSYVTEILSEQEDMLIDYSAESESGIQVNVQAPEGAFPAGTVMQAADVADEDAMQAAADTLGKTAVIRDAVAVDISFLTEDGEEIEPADGQTVSVQISLPAEKQLSGEVYTLVHVDDDGEGEIVADAQVTADGAAFEAESFSVYIVTSTRRTLGDYYDGQTIYLRLGETIELTSDDYDVGTFQNGRSYYIIGDNWDNDLEIGFLSPFLYDNNTADAAYSSGQYVVEEYWSWDRWQNRERHKVTLTAVHTTPTSGAGSQLYIRSPRGETYPVVISSPIMVKTSHGYKDYDLIREWLGGYNGTTYGLPSGGGFGLTDFEEHVPNTQDRPYLLVSGDTMEFYCDSDKEDSAFNIEYQRNDLGSAIQYTEDLGNGLYRHHVTLNTAEFIDDEYGYIHAVLPESGAGIWIKVWKPREPGDPDGVSQEMNHADMEIADGGTYTIASTRVGDDGRVYVDVKVYQADVAKVNGGYLFGADGKTVIHDRNGNPVECYSSIPDPNLPPDQRLYKKLLDSNGNPIDQPDYSQELGDYEQFGTFGKPQYEFTSAWIQNLSSRANTKLYDAEDVKSAKFDVDLHLTPRSKFTYVLENGTLTLVPSESVENWNDPSEVTTRSNIVFNMDYQDVVDARNKCPLNNGLDFTARANFTVLEMPVQKKMLKGQIPETGFQFDVFDLNTPHLISTPAGSDIAASATCGTDGKALLKDMRFIQTGTYSFKVREYKPDDYSGTLTYDDTEIYFDVIVEKIGDFLVACPVFMKYDDNGDYEPDTERKSIEFTNYEGFELPATGGTGTLPYMGGGILLISAAFILPLVRRRKEDECDS